MNITLFVKTCLTKNLSIRTSRHLESKSQSLRFVLSPLSHSFLRMRQHAAPLTLENRRSISNMLPGLKELSFKIITPLSYNLFTTG